MNFLNKKILYFCAKLPPARIFSERKFIYQYTSQLLCQEKFYQQYPNPAVYCGYDPTAQSIHLGNMLSIIMMVKLACNGFKPVFLIGGATGMIGDPSGKSKQRNLLETETILENQQGLQQTITRIYNRIVANIIANKQQYELGNINLPPLNIVNNKKFYSDMNILHFLRTIGKHFRMGHILNKETIAQRLKSEEGISYTEFSYSLLQAYDFLCLYDEYGCILQIGGSDQWGNITNGCDLIRKTKSKQAFGITMPLLLTPTGQKFGKSQGNAIYLKNKDENLYAIYQYFINTSDEQLQNLLLKFTFLPKQKIDIIMKKHNENPDIKYAQEILAKSVTNFIGDYYNVNEEYFTISYEKLIAKDKQFFNNIYSKVPKSQIFEIGRQKLEIEEDIAHFLSEHKLAQGRKQVRREVEAGGLYINNRRVEKDKLGVPIKQWLKQQILQQKYILVRWGKKKYNFILIV